MEPTKYESRPELPEPMVENSTKESLVVGPETTPNFSSTPSITPMIPQQRQTTLPQDQPQPSVATRSTTNDQVAASLIADDSDLIEKEWVLKAKAIVAQTAHDPNAQTKEVSKMKAEYLNKRYNKQLKLDES